MSMLLLKVSSWRAPHGFLCAMGEGKAWKGEALGEAMAAIGAPPNARCILPRQEHGARVVIVRDQEDGEDFPSCDGVVTDCPNIVLGVSTADCSPVLLWDRGRGIVGVAHGGWRGVAAGILENTVQAMRDLGASSIDALIGPTIRQHHFEVEQDVRDAFSDMPESERLFAPGARSGKFLFDLPGCVAARLKNIGISCTDLRMDTFSGPFPSRRRALSRGEDYRCFLSLIMLPPYI